MLPKTLQSPIAPAEPLPREHLQSSGRFGPADRAFFVADLVAEFAYPQREILILSQGVRAKSIATLDQLAPPGADCARHDGDAVEAGKRATIHVLRGDVFQRLPTGHDVDAIADLRIAGDGADLRVDETARERANCFGGKLGIRVERDDHFALSEAQTKIQRRGLTGVRLSEETNQRLVTKMFAHNFTSAILRAIVNHDDLKVLIVRIQQAANRCFDHTFLVVSR